MMKKWILLCSLFLSVCFKLAAQQDSAFLLVRTYEGDIASVALDNLDNLYVVSSTGQVKKFNAAGDSTGVYNQVRNFGKLFSVDVTNPLKLLLFYKDFSTIVVLDRFLAVLATIDLRKLSILQPGAIGLSYDNNIWVYDEYDNKLKKIDEQGNRLLETSDFRSIFNQPISPQKIINDNKLVYLADTTNGVFVFDNYGSFQKKIPLIKWSSIAIVNSTIVSADTEWITLYNPTNFMQSRRRFPSFAPYLHSYTNSNRFITFSSGKLHIYQYQFN